MTETNQALSQSNKWELITQSVMNFRIALCYFKMVLIMLFHLNLQHLSQEDSISIYKQRDLGSQR